MAEAFQAKRHTSLYKGDASLGEDPCRFAKSGLLVARRNLSACTESPASLMARVYHVKQFYPFSERKIRKRIFFCEKYRSIRQGDLP